VVIDRSAPVLAHVWFGQMYRDGHQALIGWIDLDPAVRPPRNDGRRDMEVLLETGTMEPGLPLPDRLFLDGIKVSEQLLVSLVFDFGDLTS
jgi:hypothetical protein